MPIDKTGIYNLAITLVGSSKITSLTGNSKEVRLANTLWEFSSQGMFVLPIDWRFATTRQQLSRLSTDPAFGPYSYQYEVPANCKRVISVVSKTDDDQQFEYDREVYVAGDGTETEVVLVNQLTCYVRCIRYISNIGRWPAWFSRLVALDLAILLCEPLKQDKQKKNQLYALLVAPGTGWLARAVEANGMENARTNFNNENIQCGNDDVLNAAVWGNISKRYRFNSES